MAIMILLSLIIFIIEAVAMIGLAFLTTILIITSIMDFIQELREKE